MEEPVPTVSSAAKPVVLSSFDMIKIKIKLKIKTKDSPLVFFYCFHVEPLFTSRAEWTSHTCALSHIACSQ